MGDIQKTRLGQRPLGEGVRIRKCVTLHFRNLLNGEFGTNSYKNIRFFILLYFFNIVKYNLFLYSRNVMVIY